LREDAQRDLRDLGLHIKVVDGCQELDAESKALGLSSDFKQGVLFTTYSTLIGYLLCLSFMFRHEDQLTNTDTFEQVLQGMVNFLDWTK
jgi:hypothetical protein